TAIGNREHAFTDSRFLFPISDSCPSAATATDKRGGTIGAPRDRRYRSKESSLVRRSELREPDPTGAGAGRTGRGRTAAPLRASDPRGGSRPPDVARTAAPVRFDGRLSVRDGQFLRAHRPGAVRTGHARATAETARAHGPEQGGNAGAAP